MFLGPDPKDDRLVDEASGFTGFDGVARDLHGGIAFASGQDDFGGGIFTGPDAEEDAVIRAVDKLFGSRATGFAFHARGLNRLGQIAFSYSLDDGTRGIAVATPDLDGDGIPDAIDRCMLVANGPYVPGEDAALAAQLDVDQDGIGNPCDGDFNQDGFVAGPDFDVFLQCFNRETEPGVGPVDDPDCAESDMNGDGLVGGPDFDLFLAGFNAPPGPVGNLVP